MDELHYYCPVSRPLEAFQKETGYYRVEINDGSKWLVITDKCYDYKSALKKARHNRNKYNLQTRVIAIKETTVTMFQQEVVETYDRQENKNEKN
jgi:hypothetical protein